MTDKAQWVHPIRNKMSIEFERDAVNDRRDEPRKKCVEPIVLEPGISEEEQRDMEANALLRGTKE
jgi:hypothetical protein